VPTPRVRLAIVLAAFAALIGSLAILSAPASPSQYETSEAVTAPPRPLRPDDTTTTTVPPPPTTTTQPPPPPTTTTTQAPPPPVTTTQPPPPPHPEPEARSSGVGSGDPYSDASWDRLAGCESGGDWSVNTGNGYYGGIQFSLSSWRSVGGSGYPHENSRAEQIHRGQLLWEQGGWAHWPACTSSFGWR
jgi:hypothetical protein